ncbi:hypothetical protein PoB_000561600 [Plakobranchus ocellatus]|uniref:Uncharacterized protein n=1 Tax=Plakobranchus ocellatus TaxID=259542 RepID=A0AAV3Y7B0_9GAST|nr:hypothetical protein PoB_000561600 [Plakobranchus ocellatus]
MQRNGERMPGSRADHIRKDDIRSCINRATGPYENLLTIVRRRKLKCYGHIIRPQGLAKATLQGTVQGMSRRDRQRTRWWGNIKE